MNFPTQIGVPQVIIAIIFIAASLLFYSFIRGILSKRPKDVEVEDEYKRRSTIRVLRRSFHWDRAGGSIVLALLGILLVWLLGAAQTYLMLTSRIQVAHVRATPVKNSGKPMMSVDLILYDDKGNKVSDNTYIVNGDEVFIGGDILAYQDWANILGLHSGYKLTKLEGMYSDANLERTEQHTVEVLNGGDDALFNAAYQGGASTLLVKAAYKNGSTVPPNGKGYNICVSQDAIVPQPDSQPC
jgi:hypothetical protein